MCMRCDRYKVFPNTHTPIQHDIIHDMIDSAWIYFKIFSKCYYYYCISSWVMEKISKMIHFHCVKMLLVYDDVCDGLVTPR